jgi:hypothetical protein
MSRQTVAGSSRAPEIVPYDPQQGPARGAFTNPRMRISNPLRSDDWISCRFQRPQPSPAKTRSLTDGCLPGCAKFPGPGVPFPAAFTREARDFAAPCRAVAVLPRGGECARLNRTSAGVRAPRGHSGNRSGFSRWSRRYQYCPMDLGPGRTAIGYPGGASPSCRRGHAFLPFRANRPELAPGLSWSSPNTDATWRHPVSGSLKHRSAPVSSTGGHAQEDCVHY